VRGILCARYPSRGAGHTEVADLIHGVSHRIRPVQISALGFRVQGPGSRVSGFIRPVQISGLGCRAQGSGFRVSGFRVQGCRVQVSGFGLQGFHASPHTAGVDLCVGFRIQGFGFRVQSLELTVQVSGFRV